MACSVTWGAQAGAQTAPGAVRDSVYQSELVRAPAPVDSSARVVQTDGGGAKRQVREPGPFYEPRYVMLRSLVFPGWGQFYNRQWVKGLVIGGTEVFLLLKIRQDDEDLSQLEQNVTAARETGDDALEQEAIRVYNDKLDTFVARQWLVAGLVTYALVDAYVDAHFRNFDVDFAANPSAGGAGHGDVGMRVALRWTF